MGRLACVSRKQVIGECGEGFPLDAILHRPSAFGDGGDMAVTG